MKNLPVPVFAIICAFLSLGVITISSPFLKNQKIYQAGLFAPTATTIPTAIPSPTPTPIDSIKIPILMYHYVEYVQDSKDIIRKRLDINPALFDTQLKAFKSAGYETYFVKDMPSILSGKLVPAPHRLALTFDDGYEDFYKVAFPILKKYNMKSTFYIVNDFVGRKGFVTESEIKELIDSGLVEIGAHTLDHIYLKQAPKSVIEKQIIDSKKGLEDKFNIKVETFAYPYGAYNDEAVSVVKDTEFTAAVSTNTGQTQSTKNLFTLNRIRPGALVGPNMIKILENWKN